MHHVILAKMDGLMIANAGIDQSNAGGPGNIVLLPEDLPNTIDQFRNRLKKEFNLENLGIIIADSRVQPLRKGTIGVSIASAGFEPVEDLRGIPDLFGRPLEITMRAVADDLTSAAQFLLNEGSQQTPVVVIRNAPVQFTENPSMTTELSPEKCLYMNIFSKYLLKKKEKQD
jgi:F420-0:gamma-glutamyl ligase